VESLALSAHDGPDGAEFVWLELLRDHARHCHAIVSEHLGAFAQVVRFGQRGAELVRAAPNAAEMVT